VGMSGAGPDVESTMRILSIYISEGEGGLVMQSRHRSSVSSLLLKD
jgi:hypothetical protein